MGKTKTKVGFAGKTREIEVNLPEGEPAPWQLEDKLSVVGTRVPRVDGPLKVTGRAKYTFDINLPGMLIARMLTSPMGKAKIKRLDASKAESMAGVKGIHYFKREGNPLSYHGDEILAIAAETEEIAEDALRAVEIEYDVKPCVPTIDQALKDGAPDAIDGKRNLTKQGGRPRGDIEGALKAGDKTVEATYRTQVQTHSSLESHGVVAKFEEDGSLTLWSSTQATGATKGSAAGPAGTNKIRVIAEHVGGGFGSKFALGPFGIAAIKLAQKSGKPVKLMHDREEEHCDGGNRPNSIQTMKAGVKKNGAITGLSVVTYGTAGVAGGGGGCANPMIYTFPASSKEQNDVLTNAGPGCAFRAPAHPQGAFALESFMDELALAIGMEPIEFRKKNCPDEIYHAQWDLAAEKIGWKKKWRNPPGSDTGSLKRGVGMASTRWGQSGGGNWQVDVEVFKEGRVEVRNATQDIGVGTRTLLAIIVAEELGISPNGVTVRLGDTTWPAGPASGGSQTAPSIGPAARNAGIAAKKKLVELAGGKELAFEAACKNIQGESFVVSGRRSKNYEGYREQVAGCQFAEVEVDTETGRVRALHVVAVQDAGRIINKLAFESQIIGGVIQGISYALFEDRILDRNQGTMVNADFLNYKIAGPRDMPVIEAVAFDVANAKNNCGMMGLGEPPVIPTAGAVANAVANAIGARVREIPITPARVLAALKR